jgi:type IV pilus assembly protein PilB
MAPFDEHIKKVLVENGYLSEEDALQIERIVEEEGIPFDFACVSRGILTNDLIGQALAESYGMQYADLNSHPPSKDQVRRIPEDIGKKYRVVLFKEEKKTVILTTDTPKKMPEKKIFSDIFPGKEILIKYSISVDIDTTLLHYRKDLSVRLQELTKGGKDKAPEYLREIFTDAVLYKASDIHFEPWKTFVLVRFRVDGVLRDMGKISHERYLTVLNRMKVQGEMRIDEHHTTQDGAMRYQYEGGIIDMRISIIPTITGEKTVIRLLAEYVKGFALDDVGFSLQDKEVILRAIQKPFGMILVTGPTGSGKTTTLYALLKLLHKPSVNITTIEDPVEYKIAGINQIKVNERAGITFAKGLRSIVRQDPDVILVGEIRDRETAEIAINAALTGHLVLSTFHANDAATAIPRLIDIGIEPFLLASTLELVVGQRLVRKISEECRVSTMMTRKEIEKIKPSAGKYFTEKTTLYAPTGCTDLQKQYSGRIGIFESISMTPALKELVLQNPSAREVWMQARKEGARTLFEDGVEKVLAGKTSIQELLRFAEPPEEYVEKKAKTTRKKTAKA